MSERRYGDDGMYLADVASLYLTTMERDLCDHLIETIARAEAAERERDQALAKIATLRESCARWRANAVNHHKCQAYATQPSNEGFHEGAHDIYTHCADELEAALKGPVTP